MASRFGFRSDYAGSHVADMIVAPPTSKVVVVTKTTAANVTYTADELLTGLILRDPAGAARTDTLPTAALLVAAGITTGTGIRFSVRNTADVLSEDITVAAGTGITAHASTRLTVVPGETAEFLLVVTAVASGSEAAALYQLSGNNASQEVQTVSQGTNITTAVTLNARVGVITTQAATTAADATSSFTLNNAYITAGSVVLVALGDYSGTIVTNGIPQVNADAVAAGSCTINISNSHGANALNGTLKLHFVVIR